MTVNDNRTILKPPTIENPGVIGRLLRIGIGASQLQFISQALPLFDLYGNSQPASFWIPYFIAIAIALAVLPDVVNLGLCMNWGGLRTSVQEFGDSHNYVAEINWNH